MIPLVDLSDPDPAAVDEGLTRAGFLLVAGHGVDAGPAGAVRAAAGGFFALPVAVEERYAVRWSDRESGSGPVRVAR